MRLACPVVATAVVLGLGLAVAEAATGRSPSAHRFGCRPQPGIGSVAVLRGKSLYTIDLATCRQHRVGASGPGRVAFGADGRAHVRPSSPLVAAGGRFTATVRVTGRQKTLRDTIWVTDRQTGKAHAVFSAGEWGDTRGLGSPGPIVLFAWSADARWLFFAIDPGASGSIAADGLILQVVSANAGGPHRLRVMLPDTDYLTWCGGRLVFTAGADRVATDNKRLLSAVPPAWRVLPLVNDPGRAWGSLPVRPTTVRSSFNHNRRAATLASSPPTGLCVASISTERARG